MNEYITNSMNLFNSGNYNETFASFVFIAPNHGVHIKLEIFMLPTVCME
jgi:hypothetical protein